MTHQHIVVSGGAGYWSGPDGIRLDEYVLSLTGTSRPRVCAIFAASGDLPAHVEGFYDTLGPRCTPSHLPLFTPPDEPPERLLASQDLIYVGGGNTVSLLAVLRAHGIDRILRQAHAEGTILYGSSAGGLCWFEGGLSNSVGFDGHLRPLRDGLGLLRGSHAPHYDRAETREIYRAAIASGELSDGIGIDDHACVHFVDGTVREVASALPGQRAHLVAQRDDHRVELTALDATPI